MNNYGIFKPEIPQNKKELIDRIRARGTFVNHATDYAIYNRTYSVCLVCIFCEYICRKVW